jgi:hypothetical protein
MGKGPVPEFNESEEEDAFEKAMLHDARTQLSSPPPLPLQLLTLLAMAVFAYLFATLCLL